MENVTFEEMSLMCIYNSTGTREGLIDALTEMRGYLGPDETELLALTDSSSLWQRADVRASVFSFWGNSS